MKIIYNALKNILENWFKFIDQTTEIKVVSKRDRHGNSYWLAFDPVTKSYSYLSSETEVRMWIEQSYYSRFQ